MGAVEVEGCRIKDWRMKQQQGNIHIWFPSLCWSCNGCCTTETCPFPQFWGFSCSVLPSPVANGALHIKPILKLCTVLCLTAAGLIISPNGQRRKTFWVSSSCEETQLIRKWAGGARPPELYVEMIASKEMIEMRVIPNSRGDGALWLALSCTVQQLL